MRCASSWRWPVLRTRARSTSSPPTTSRPRTPPRGATLSSCGRSPDSARGLPSGDARGLAADENNRGLIAQTLGDFVGARRAFEAALAANRGVGRRGAAAVNFVNLGNLAALSGEPEAAAGRYREALALYRAEDDR